MRDYAFLNGERAREPEDVASDEVVFTHAMAGRRTRTSALRETLYRHAVSAHSREHARTARATELVSAALGGGGISLPPAIRRRLESIVQADLSGVRVHTGRAADAAAVSVGARAFAVGNELVFADGAYAPGSVGGDWLLAHEATHAARHRGASGVAEDRAAEDEASAVADAYVAGDRAPDAAHVTAVRGLLRSVSASVDTEDVHRLAIQYGAAIGLTRWSLGADRQDIAQRMIALIEHARMHQCADAHARVTQLDDATRSTVERTTGVALGDVSVERGADLGAPGRLGEAVGSTIRLAAEASGDDDLARKVRLHEAIHVAQGRVSDDSGPAPADRTAAVETEAHAAAAAAERGERRPLGVKADPAQRYGFDLGDAARALGIDPMKFLREHFPQVASFLGGGFGPILQQLGDAAGSAVQGVLSGIGLGGLQSGFDAFTASFKPGGLAFGILHGCCECLDHALNDLMKSVQGALNSGAAQKIRGWIEKIQDAENNRIIDEVADFFAALKTFGGPVLAGINKVVGWIEQADQAVGHSILWKAIAPMFGLDPNLTPLEAIKKKLSDMWATVKAGWEAAKKALSDLWAAIKANSVVQAITKFFGDCGKLISALKKVYDSKSNNPKDWLGILAKEMKGTIFEGAINALQGTYTNTLALRDAAIEWFFKILDKLGLLGAWNSAVPYIRAIGQAIQKFARSIQATITAIKTAIHKALTALADGIQKLWEGIKPYVSFVVGLGIALVLTFSGDIFAIPRFVMGQLWLHVLPHCYKASLTNFLLDLFIALVEWFPAKHPIMILLRSAALSFLRTIKAASEAKKIAAMDTIAKVMSNDIEVVAGFFVGVVKGLWNSSLGFIVQMAIYPFQLAWDVLSTIGSVLMNLAGKAFGVVFEGASWFVNAMASARQRGPGGKPVPGGDQPSPDNAQAQPPPPEKVTTTVPVEPRPPAQGHDDTTDGDTGGSAPASASPAGGTPRPSGAPGAQPQGAGAQGAGAQGAGAQGAGAQGAPSQGAPQGAPQDHGSQGPEGGSAPGGEHSPAGGDSLFEDLPPFPKLPPLRDLVDHVFNKGVSREEIEAMFKKLNIAMDQWGTKLGAQGGQKILAALTAQSAPYDVGEIIGEVVGWLAGEIIMLVFTEGIENAIAKFAEGIMDGARIIAKIGEYFPKLAEWLMEMRKLIEPVIEAIEKIAAKAKEFLKKIMKWFEDMLAWVKRQWQRLLKWLEETFGELGKMMKKAFNWLIKEEGEIEAELEAEEAANVAFEEMDLFLTNQAVPHAEMEARLARCRVPHTPDVQIKLYLETGPMHWRIGAKATKGAHHGIGLSLAAGGVMFDRELRPWYTARGHATRHLELLEEAWVELDTEALAADKEKGGNEPLPEEYAVVEGLATRIQTKFQAKLPLPHSTQFRITLERLDSRDVQNEGYSNTEFTISPNTSSVKKHVHIVQGKSAFGAVKKGTGFTGWFDVNKEVRKTKWNWAAYPSGPITQHPGNVFMHYRNANNLGSLKPPDGEKYTFIGGTESPGGPAGPLKAWRKHLENARDDYKQQFIAHGEDPEEALEEAEEEVVKHYKGEGYSGLDWDDLMLQGPNQWQAHHIWEHSWGGVEENNLQYLKRPDEHQAFSNWWNTRRDDIYAGLKK